MAEIAAESEGFAGYGEWSAALENSPSTENFVVRDGKVYHKAEPRSPGASEASSYDLRPVLATHRAG